VSAPIVVDGVPDEAAWRGIAPLPLTMYTPVFRGTPTQRTEIRVGYDDEHFYAAGWFYDTEPDQIRVNSLYRDRWNGDDTLAIYIDPFNDNQNAKWFGTTAAGMRFDQLVSDDGATLNGNWDAVWTSRARITAEGWFVEVRIPFSTLGFRADETGRSVMGLTVTRLVSRHDERVTFPEIDPAFPFRRPSLARDVVLRDVRTRTPIYFTPYVLGGRNRTQVAGDPARDTQRDVGLDIRYPVTSRMTLDLTLNTDFAQVEADEQQVALDRFPLFFPERRRFFQENAGLFDFISAGGTRLFHSRRIGLTDDLQPVPIIGGARLVGRLGDWEVGALEMQTDDQAGIPGENFGVLRMRRPVLNDFSTAGLMMTSVAGGGRRNLALAGDTSLRVYGDEYLGLKWATTVDGHDPGGLNVVERSLIDAKWERRTGRGLAYTMQYTRAGERYDPALGFLPRRDFTTANLLANWYRFTDDHPVFRRVWPGALAFSTFRNSDGALESAQYAVWVQWETKAGGGGWIEPKLFHENVLQPFRIGGAADIPAGVYNFADLQFVYSMPTGARARAGVDVRSGTYFDGTRTQVIVSPTWNVSRHLELGGDYQLSVLRFPSRSQAVDIHLARLRVRTALDTRLSSNALIQYNSTTDRLDFNVRVRYAFAEGTDFWFVYNEGVDTDQEDALVPQPRSLARAFIVKYTHTFGG